MLPVQTQYLHPRKWPAFIPMLISIGLLLVGLSGQKLEGFPIICSVLALVSLLLWLAFKKAQITIDDTGLIYKTVFVTKEISWQHITKAYLKYHHHGKSGSYYLHFDNEINRSVKFSIALYSRASLKILAEAIISKCKKAEIEDRIVNMAEGKFPWYIF